MPRYDAIRNTGPFEPKGSILWTIVKYLAVSIGPTLLLWLDKWLNGPRSFAAWMGF